MNRKATYAFGLAALVALLIGAAFAATADASPAWKFEGKALEGSEDVLGGAVESAMTVPGLTTSCENFLYELSISNKEGTGKGSLTEMPLYNCTAHSTACSVGSIGAEGLPWSSHLTTVETNPYVIFEGVKVSIYYEGEECVLGETLVTVKGSAGGQINNSTESATFNTKTLEATKTTLEALGQKIEWNGVFPTEAFQWHREQPLSVS